VRFSTKIAFYLGNSTREANNCNKSIGSHKYLIDPYLLSWLWLLEWHRNAGTPNFCLIAPFTQQQSNSAR